MPSRCRLATTSWPVISSTSETICAFPRPNCSRLPKTLSGISAPTSTLRVARSTKAHNATRTRSRIEDHDACPTARNQLVNLRDRRVGDILDGVSCQNRPVGLLKKSSIFG